jgi:hypothetical protein
MVGRVEFEIDARTNEFPVARNRSRPIYAGSYLVALAPRRPTRIFLYAHFVILKIVDVYRRSPILRIISNSCKGTRAAHIHPGVLLHNYMTRIPRGSKPPNARNAAFPKTRTAATPALTRHRECRPFYDNPFLSSAQFWNARPNEVSPSRRMVGNIPIVTA